MNRQADVLRLEHVSDVGERIKLLFRSYLAYEIVSRLIGFTLVLLAIKDFEFISFEAFYFGWCLFSCILAACLLKNGPTMDNTYFLVCKVIIELFFHFLYTLLLFVNLALVLLGLDVFSKFSILPQSLRSAAFAFSFFAIKSLLTYYGEYGIIYYVYFLICKEDDRKIEEERLNLERKENEERRARREEKYPIVGSLINKLSTTRGGDSQV